MRRMIRIILLLSFAIWTLGVLAQPLPRYTGYTVDELMDEDAGWQAELEKRPWGRMVTVYGRPYCMQLLFPKGIKRNRECRLVAFYHRDFRSMMVELDRFYGSATPGVLSIPLAGVDYEGRMYRGIEETDGWPYVLIKEMATDEKGR